MLGWATRGRKNDESVSLFRRTSLEEVNRAFTESTATSQDCVEVPGNVTCIHIGQKGDRGPPVSLWVVSGNVGGC